MPLQTIRVFLVVFLMSQSVFAQRTETTLNFDTKVSHLMLEVENDLLFQSDQYYTAGIAFYYTHERLKKTPAQLILKSKDADNLRFSGFGIEHRMFTPFSIVDPEAIENDRPYSAYLLATNFSVLINPKKHLTMSNEIGIGIIGPGAGGEELQSFIHGLIGSEIPIGWEKQINNAFLIDYQFRIEKGFFGPWLSSHLIPIAELRAGTLKDQINLGLLLKFGNKWQAISSGEMHSNTDSFIWECVMEAKLQGVFYDATLQGGLMNGDEIVTLSIGDTFMRQYHIRFGGNLYYKTVYLRYMVQLNSPDFSVGIVHRYGGVTLGFSF
jgi:hypothetical protein